MKKHLRLLLWEECNRKCEGCCNQQFDLANLPVCEDFSQYELIMLTGGEPMLYPDKVVEIAREIRKQSHCPIIMYTAKVDDLKAVYKAMFVLDGWTVTLHETEDVKSFRRMASFIDPYNYHGKKEKLSLRVNIFKGVNIDDVPWNDLCYHNWKIKRNIEWLDPCPIPYNEDFMRWKSV
jgi:organic radical activating enzyme